MNGLPLFDQLDGRKSQCRKLLEEFLKGRRLTKVTMLRELGILNGGGRAWDLKHGIYDGVEYPVKMEKVAIKTRDGVAKVGEYFLLNEGTQ